MPANAVVLDERDLVRTRNTPEHEDTYTAVVDSQAVTHYASEHPSASSSTISTALGIPRGRIRP